MAFNAYAACPRHVNQALIELNKNATTKLYKIFNVARRQNYRCTCGKPATWFFRELEPGEVKAKEEEGS